jgi:hypothetical protein
MTGAYYVIPCGVLERVPALLRATAPEYGGNRDNFLPRSGCGWRRGFVAAFPDADVNALMDADEGPTHGYFTHYAGTLRFYFWSLQAKAIEELRLDPSGELARAPAAAPTAPPYFVWSYLSLDNRRVQAATQAVFERANAAVTGYFEARGLNDADAARAADAGLRQLMFGPDCGGADLPAESPRTLLMDGAPLSRIEAFMANARSQGHFVSTESAEILRCAEFGGIDPLAHIAAARPDALPLLSDIIDTDARNPFGKTPLMTAAQYDFTESVRFLLAHGADPNARTAPTGTAWAERTPLMYAAANASLGTIKLLLEAGADPLLADSKGLKALHYLLGLGPVPANPRLNAAELAEAARLLF